MSVEFKFLTWTAIPAVPYIILNPPHPINDFILTHNINPMYVSTGEVFTHLFAETFDTFFHQPNYWAFKLNRTK